MAKTPSGVTGLDMGKMIALSSAFENRERTTASFKEGREKD